MKRFQFNWEKRVQIIEGIIQGLLYLQEYSRVTIIHRDINASNILLDKDLNPRNQILGWLEYSKRMDLKQTQAGL